MQATHLAQGMESDGKRRMRFTRKGQRRHGGHEEIGVNDVVLHGVFAHIGLHKLGELPHVRQQTFFGQAARRAGRHVNDAHVVLPLHLP